MNGLELVCLAIVASWIVLRVRREPRPLALLGRLLLLAVAGWVGEESMILVHGFYVYTPSAWTVFLDRVPLLIVVIWPIVIHSAWDLARGLLGEKHRAVPLVAGALVLADASLIEPIAVRAGLWAWTEPGLFSVPPIGILGWAVFAALAIAILERAPRAAALLAIPLAPLGTHAILVALWWLFFRWTNRTVPEWPAFAVLAAASATLVLWIVRTRPRVVLADLTTRVPGAVFFFALLALHAREHPALIAWSLAFAPPYLALVRAAAVGARGERPVVGRSALAAEDLVDRR